MKHKFVLYSVLFFAINIYAVKADEKLAPDRMPLHPDLDKIPPAIVAAEHVDWQGLYFGAHWGVAKGLTAWSKPIGYAALRANDPFFNRSGNDIGLFVGMTAGYQLMIGPWVMGPEVEYAGANLKSTAKCSGSQGVFSLGIGFQCRSETHRIGSVTSRLGYAFGRSLFFVKAGSAYANIKTRVSYPWPSADTGYSQSAQRYGLVFGLGYEYALGDRWSTKVEYDYNTFNAKFFKGKDRTRATTGASSDATIHQLKFGLNYHFGALADPSAELSPTISQDLSGEVGVRLGWSAGQFTKYLYDPSSPSRMNSRINWMLLNGPVGETFFRADHSSDFFAKGLVGGLKLMKGKMTDEDFYESAASYALTDPPIYSKSEDQTKKGQTLYGTFDVGYDFYHNEKTTLGAFIGYNYYEQKFSSYGCHQVASSPYSCYFNKYPISDLTYTQSERWHSMRLGLNQNVRVTDSIKINLDAAWLPISHLVSYDYHWLRADINPMREKGDGYKNYQLEAVLSYDLTEKMRIGLGARYWNFEGTGRTVFPNMRQAAPLAFKSYRSTVFLQLAYVFGAAGSR